MENLKAIIERANAISEKIELLQKHHAKFGWSDKSRWAVSLLNNEKYLLDKSKRVIELIQEANKMQASLLAENSGVFTASKGEPYYYKNIRKGIEEARKG
jgi:hypothetical protein